MASDGRHLAFVAEGADVTYTLIVDAVTGEQTELGASGPVPADCYCTHSAGYRAFDGSPGVVCCHDGDVGPDDPETSRLVVLHDPTTGAERDRFNLPFSAGAAAYDPFGNNQLLVASPDGRVVLRSPGGDFTRVGDLEGVFSLAW